MKTLEEMRQAYADAAKRMREAADALEAAPDSEFEARQKDFDEARQAADAAHDMLRRAEAIAEARTKHPAPQAPPAGAERRDTADVKVTREEPTYRADGEHSFFRDVWQSRKGDHEAAERVRRNDAEAIDHYRREGRLHEYRDVTTGSGEGAGVIPPVYLTDLYVGIRREARPAADIFPKMPLPEQGMSITIPRMTAGASVDVQYPEGNPVSETDVDTDTISVPVVTIAGLQDFTLQLMERSNPAFDALIMAELTALHAQRVDLQVLAGSGSNSQHTGIRNVGSINTVTYTDATPTAAEATPKLYDAIQKIASGYYGRATHILMSPRRAAWFASQLSSSFPLFQQGGYAQAIGSQDKGAVLSLAGLPVIEDGNIGTAYGSSTDEDEIYVVAADASPLMEGGLRVDVHDQPLGDQLKVRVRVFSYSAFASTRYPKSITKVSGTGLKTPSF